MLPKSGFSIENLLTNSSSSTSSFDETHSSKELPSPGSGASLPSTLKLPSSKLEPLNLALSKSILSEHKFSKFKNSEFKSESAFCDRNSVVHQGAKEHCSDMYSEGKCFLLLICFKNIKIVYLVF